MENNLPISLISNLFNPVSPSFAGGLEVFNYYLARELEKQNVDVKLFASGDSEKIKSLVSVVEKSLANSQDAKFLSIPWNYRKMTVEEFGIYTKFIQEQKNDRLIHFSLVNFLPVYLAIKKNLPIITTIHMPVDNRHYQILLELLTEDEIKKANFIGVSKSQVKNFPVRQVIHNGVSTEDFHFAFEPRESFIWVGRMIEEKGCPDAIEAAKRSNIDLEIGGKPQNAMEEKFFQEKIEPNFDERISYKGFVEKKDKNLFYAAKALLFTPKWEEPFGLIMLEALACGTPVIAYSRGATSEIIQDDFNGFLLQENNPNELSAVIDKLQEMPENQYLAMRQNCRKFVEDNFSFKKVTDDYLQIYQQIWNSK